MNDLVEKVARALCAIQQAEREEIRRQALRDAAQLIRTSQPSYGGDEVVMKPRIDGNRDGLPYADAILALIDGPAAPAPDPKVTRWNATIRWIAIEHAKITVRDALSALQNEIAGPPTGAPDRDETLQLALDAAQDAIDDYDETRNGSQRRSMELLRLALALARTR
jgi:hypothetical protein